MEKEKLVMRAERKMFMGVNTGSSETIHRVKGFSSLSESKNPVEYTRKYVDEMFETTDVTGMSPSYDFTFDLMTPNAVLDDISQIIDGEKLGTDAVRTFYCVDFHKPEGGGFKCVKRDFAIIGSSVGDGTDALTYSGTLRVKTAAVEGIATISTPVDGNKDTVETIEFSTSETTSASEY